MTRTTVANTIADRVSDTEKRNARALGHDEIDVFLLSTVAWGETFERAFEPLRPAVHLDPRMVENRS